MPTFENIVLTLQSQYDALRIPERLSASSDRSSPSSHHHGCIIEVDIPSYTGSQFWISYDCASSTTEGDDDDRDGSGGGRFDPKVRFYFFRLHVLDGACLLNWGVGEHDDWRGKTMFGLYDGGSDFEGKKVVEKRGMFFPSRREPRRDAGFEVQVFRSRARVKQKTAFAKSRSVGSGDALGLKNIGNAVKGERQRLYAYALIDAKDEPMVTFRYRFRAPDAISAPLKASSGQTFLPSKAVEGCRGDRGRRKENGSSDGASESDSAPSTPSSIQQASSATILPITPSSLRRLSFPPRTRFQASTSSSEPSSPIKKLMATVSESDLARSVRSAMSKRK